jgi:hypothetical protein
VLKEFVLVLFTTVKEQLKRNFYKELKISNTKRVAGQQNYLNFCSPARYYILVVPKIEKHINDSESANAR